MVSYIKSLYYYLFDSTSEVESDDDKERFLSDQLTDLEINALKTDDNTVTPFASQTQQTAVCYQRTGVITYIADNDILIDGTIFFDITACGLNLHVNDKILYLAYKDPNKCIVVVRILETFGSFWGDENEAIDEISYSIMEHVFVGEVDHRENRTVFIKDGNLKFDLDNVIGTFIPVQGDWLELLCKVKFNHDKPMDISFDGIIEVLSFKPVRSKIKPAIITEWTGDTGICDKMYFFDKSSIVNGTLPTVGSKVFIEAIESSQGMCTWRVIKMQVTEILMVPEKLPNVEDIEVKSLEVESQQNIEVTLPLKFDKVNFQENPYITLNITNNSGEQITLNKWIILCKKRDSQININPFITRPRKIYPKQTFSLTITCYPKFFGQSKEHLIISFRGFQVERWIRVNVLPNALQRNNVSNGNAKGTTKLEQEKITMLKGIRQDERPCVPGIKLVRPANFIAVKLGLFSIPEKIWAAVLGNPNENLSCLSYDQMVERLETKLPCLLQTLSINNYTDKWHTLLYMEEVKLTINMRTFDTPKGFLVKYQEYLGIKITGLAERRPSLIIGDRAIVKDMWNDTLPSYEGFIHLIKGDLVLMKFHPQFHQTYLGSDVSIEFHFNRSKFRRAHQAVNLAISNLGPNILFPSHLIKHPPQIPHEKTDDIEWYNTDLNSGQKSAVKNILLGECRPMPYCIYGPPGTGKTITIVETILQIITHVPDSRIVIAAPSNSAVNLITERLLHYKHLFSTSIVRIIANYLVDSEDIPDIIKPYCATINVAREDTVKSTHVVKHGINLNVSMSYIARFRISIGTCYGLGILTQLGLPKGHFTHVIVDEAGQAIEPEIMIPFTFIDKANGQIIVAGDPMQLGPVFAYKYCEEFGYGESYLSRLLESFPYQRDHSIAIAYNEKLITRLTENYRSLGEVIQLPSKMFYDGSLVAKLDRTLPWIKRMIDVLSEVFEITSDSKAEGVFVIGIRGCNTRAEDSPSWFNAEEASMIALTVCKLYKKNITAEDIGIISPYLAQIKYIRVLFDAMGLPRPKIATVEEFQGQERPIIFISTVRTSEHYVAVDQKHFLGFVKNPKRCNVALTRAQIAVFLFCDPHLLSTDIMWKAVINHAVKNDRYFGCDLPLAYNNKNDDLIVE